MQLKSLAICGLVACAGLAPAAQADLLLPADIVKNAVEGLLSSKVNALATPATSLLSGFSSVLTSLANSVVGIVSEKQTALSSDINGLQASANSTLQSVGYELQQVGNQFEAISNQASTQATGLFGEIISIVKGEYNALQGVVDQLSSIYDNFFTEFCSPPTFTPSGWEPATFTGPGFKLTLSGGNATVDAEEFILTDGGFDFTGPSISFEDIPAKFTSKYKSAPVFQGESCNLTKSLAAPQSQILYVFDPSSQFNQSDILSYLLQEASSLLGLAGFQEIGVVPGPVSAPPAPPAAATLTLQQAAQKVLSTLFNVNTVPVPAATQPAAYASSTPVTMSALPPPMPQATVAAAMPPPVPQATAAAAATVSAGTSVPTLPPPPAGSP